MQITQRHSVGILKSDQAAALVISIDVFIVKIALPKLALVANDPQNLNQLISLVNHEFVLLVLERGDQIGVLAIKQNFSLGFFSCLCLSD